MNVNIQFDSSALSAPAGFQNSVLIAAAMIDAVLTDNITINIAVGYGEMMGLPLTNQAGAAAGLSGGNLYNYDQIRNLLISQASAGDTTFNALPAGTSIQGQSQVVLWTAEEKALGLLNPNNAGIDGEIGIGSNVPSSLWISTALNQIGHVMGRFAYGDRPDIFDLFRFTSPGNRLFLAGNTSPAAYFSIDGGVTDLADYGHTSSSSDFLNSSNRTPEDAFNEFSDPATLQLPTAVDLEQFDALGYHLGGPIYPITRLDFNSTGTADILWRNASGMLSDWDVEGGAINSAPITSNGAIVSPDASWSVAGISDFNGDHKADVLWRNGLLADWFMSGPVIGGSGYLNVNGSNVTPDPSWSIAGIGDLSGDGKSDLLWRNANGSTAVWIMDGSSIVGSGYLNVNGTIIAPDPSWSVVGTGDFNGDKYSDLLWRNAATGELAEWQLHSSDIIGSADVNNGSIALRPDASWTVAGIGDFDGDGDADILWRNGNGTVSEWLMRGSTVTDGSAITYHGAAVNVAANWKVAEIGDFNGDGSSDILWRDSTTGQLAEWLMIDNVLTVATTLKSNSVTVNPDLSWTAQAKSTNFA
jgi:FG-GAP-like repeat